MVYAIHIGEEYGSVAERTALGNYIERYLQSVAPGCVVVVMYTAETTGANARLVEDAYQAMSLGWSAT